MADGRIYISDKTAESFGGRERVEEIFERVGNGGNIVVFGSQDTPEDVESLFWQAKRGSVGFFSWVSQDTMDQVLEIANTPAVPVLMVFDINKDGKFDISSFRDTPELFDKGVDILPGDRQTVREFLFAHELGHADLIYPKTFWDRWRNETNADQDGFRGLGEKATHTFQEGILAARAGNALGDMIALQELKLDSRSTYNLMVDNPEFIHTTVLGTFLQGEEAFTVTESGLNGSLDSFRDRVFGRLYDNQMAKTPNFRLDITSIETSDVNYYYQRSFEKLVEQQEPVAAGRYEQFISNMKDIDDRQDRLWEQYRELEDDQQDRKDAIYAQITGLQEEMKVELQQGLDFMRETNPDLYRQHIISEYFGLFNRQTGMVNLEVGDREPKTFIADIQRPMLDAVLQLRAEGAFTNDPVQKRLTDYIVRDAALRPDFYGLEKSPAATAPENSVLPPSRP